VVADAVRIEPVSPCNFGESRVVFTRCREAERATLLKAHISQWLGWDSPYSRSREAMLISSENAEADIGIDMSRRFTQVAPLMLSL
jgi:hypothetical protein